MNKTRDEIIVMCIQIIYEGKSELAQQVKEKLKEFAKFYKVNHSDKLPSINSKTALNDFILNKKGYIKTIPKLYNAL